MALRVSKYFLGLMFGALSATAAEAHVGLSHTVGFVQGFAHPLGGMDHVLAMVAVGLLAVRLGGRALLLVPLSFVVMMALGGILGMGGWTLPFVEGGIALSVIVLGALVATQSSMPTVVAMALAGVFAVFHGFAHGAEMPVDAQGLAYGAGFVGATLLLHAAGMFAGLAIARSARKISRPFLQVAGAVMALCGVGLLAGL